MSMPNVSDDLVWELVRNYNALMVKRPGKGSPILSRDPLNLTNKHSRKHAGFVNSKAIGVQATANGGIKVLTKSAKKAQHHPGKAIATHSHGQHKSNRKIYKSVASLATRNNYRADLRSAAVERVSAIRRAQKPVKASPEKKLRGNAAKKATEEKA